MADPTDDPRPDDEADGGGPVKSFLEHLEDLRWVLIKTSVAVLLGMVVCLLAVNKVVSVLKWPLERARALNNPPGLKVDFLIGTNRIGSVYSPTNRFGPFDFGKERRPTLSLEPVLIGTNYLMALRWDTNAPTSSGPDGKGPDLIYLDPAAPFVSSLHLAFFGGLLLAAPFVFYFLGEFIVPALRIKEKRVFLRAFAVGVLLFLVGVSFCYFLIMPLALRAAEAYSLWMGIAMPDWRAETYFSFVMKFMLGMGLGFEMPVVLLALVRIGILDYQKLAGFRRYMIIVNLILGALLTTPEVLTQVMMFLPLQLLYEASIWIAWYWERQEKKKNELNSRA